MDTLVRTLATNRDVPGWEETSTNWLIAAVVISIVIALIMIFTKLLKKKRASGPVQLTWTPKRTSLFTLTALLPLAAVMAAVWYFSINFHSVVGVAGLLKGILIGWLLYVACMLAAHAALWRRDLF